MLPIADPPPSAGVAGERRGQLGCQKIDSLSSPNFRHPSEPPSSQKSVDHFSSEQTRSTKTFFHILRKSTDHVSNTPPKSNNDPNFRPKLARILGAYGTLRHAAGFWTHRETESAWRKPFILLRKIRNSRTGRLIKATARNIRLAEQFRRKRAQELLIQRAATILAERSRLFLRKAPERASKVPKAPKAPEHASKVSKAPKVPGNGHPAADIDVPLCGS